jgi:glycosyltransferase involved in cell wall biosynthesis
MRILINGRFFRQKLTGVQRYAIEISQRLVSDPKYYVVVPSAIDKPGEHKDKYITVPDNWITSFAKTGWSLLILPRVVSPTDTLWSPANIGPIQVKRHVVTLHDLSIYENPQWFSRKFVAGYKLVLPILMRSCNHVVTDSEYSRQGILEQFRLAPDKVSVVYPAASERFRPADRKDISIVRSKYNLPENYFLSLSSTEPRKNIGRLLAAWSRLVAEALGDVSLVIAGDRAKTFADPGLKDMVRSAKNVVFTGYFPDDDLPALYSSALTFVYPSMFEGFGLPPLEAMACGTPVLCSNATSLPEVVGDAAFMFDPYDVEAIEDALRHMLAGKLPRNKMRSLGLERARTFSWDRSARQIADILESV